MCGWGRWWTRGVQRRSGKGRDHRPPSLDHELGLYGHGCWDIDELEDRREPVLEGALAAPLVAPPGWGFLYNNGASRMLSAVSLSRSTDKGKTFTVAEIGPPSNTFINGTMVWSPQAGPAGTLHLVYHSTTPRKVEFEYDVFHRRSPDRGETWTDERVLNDDDPAHLMDQVHASVSLAPNGRIDVAWWDFRNGTGTFANDVYMTSSVDNGGSWSKNLRVTDRSVNRRIGPWFGNADIRQPPGLVALDEFTLVLWDDTRNGDDLTQTQDVFSSIVQYEALGGDGPSPAAMYALAGVIGFGVVSLGFLTAALRSRWLRTPD